MDYMHIVLALSTAVLSGGLFPFLIKLCLDKRKLKKEQEQIQNLKIEKLGEILLLYINSNGTKKDIKKKCAKKLDELMNVGMKNL